jgi:hypothetical protein
MLLRIGTRMTRIKITLILLTICFHLNWNFLVINVLILICQMTKQRFSNPFFFRVGTSASSAFQLFCNHSTDLLFLTELKNKIETVCQVHCVIIFLNSQRYVYGLTYLIKRSQPEKSIAEILVVIPLHRYQISPTSIPRLNEYFYSVKFLKEDKKIPRLFIQQKPVFITCRVIRKQLEMAKKEVVFYTKTGAMSFNCLLSCR